MQFRSSADSQGAEGVPKWCPSKAVPRCRAQGGKLGRAKTSSCGHEGEERDCVPPAFRGVPLAIQSIPDGVALKRALERLLFHLPTATITFPILENYVSRPSLEGGILRVYNSSRESDAYTVIVGPKGTGKSSVVAHVLNNKSGVLYLDVSEADTEKNNPPQSTGDQWRIR